VALGLLDQHPVGVVTVVLAFKVLPESRDETANARPDMLGAVLVALATGSLALALVKAPSWGWTSRDFFGLLVLALASSLGVVVRSARHDAPVVDLKLLESRSFNGAILASIAYYAGFGAFLLSMVEFLTGVWHFSAIDAGLAIAPGPLMVLPFARVVAPRLSAKLGQRAASRSSAVSSTSRPSHCGSRRFRSTRPTPRTSCRAALGWSGRWAHDSVADRCRHRVDSPARFGTGSGVLNMARQIGTVLGVAGLIAILAGLNVADPVVAFRHATELVIGFFALAGLTSAALLSRRVTTSTT